MKQLLSLITSYALILLVVIGSGCPAYGQFNKKSNKRAVVIGISDYQDEAIPDLQFAHRDAEAAANYFTQIDPLPIPADQIVLLTNEMATGGNVHQALNKLLLETQPSDQVFIFFSGHGDVETISEKDLGHLLLYDTPSSTYQINSLRISDLKGIVDKLSREKGATVTLITDACRSGNLAGQLVRGTQATAASLLSQFANETKILSCQPDQYSAEGTQWGGGRGAFSFHLIEGLIGLADVNKDFQVTITELQRYLEDRLTEDLGQQQLPVIRGNQSKIISFVNEEKLVELVEVKSGDANAHPNVFASIFSDSPSGSESSASFIISEFYNSLEAGQLFPTNDSHDTTEPQYISALELYDSLLQKNVPDARIRGIKADFITALQDDSQRAINNYLKSTNETLNERDLGRGKRYENFPLYLQKAADLLGPSHYLYSQLTAKAYYFDAVIHRLNQSYEHARELIEKALVYEDRAAYIFNELGFLYDRDNDPRALDMYQLAQSLSPNWVIPYGNMASYYLRQKNYLEAERFAVLSIEKGPHYKYSYWTLSETYRRTDRIEEAEQVLLDYLQRYGDDWFIFLKLGSLVKQDDLDKAIFYFKESNIAQESKSAHQELGLAYYGVDDSLLVYHFKRGLELNPLATELLNNLGWFYFLKNDLEHSKEYYQRALEIDPNILYARLNLGKIFFRQQKWEDASINFNYLLTSINSNHTESHYFLGRIAAKNGKSESALMHLEKAINGGFQDKNTLLSDEYLMSLLEDPRFEKLLQSIPEKQ